MEQKGGVAWQKGCMDQALDRRPEAIALRIVSMPSRCDTGAEEVKVRVRREVWRRYRNFCLTPDLGRPNTTTRNLQRAGNHGMFWNFGVKHSPLAIRFLSNHETWASLRKPTTAQGQDMQIVMVRGLS
jgi:hypothetical protein